VGTDVSPDRLEMALAMGADAALDVRTARVADAQRELGLREGFDVGFEMSGAPSALPEMIANMNHGGRIAMLGLPSAPIAVDWGTVVTHMLTLKGIYGREMFETWQAMDAMLRTSETLRGAIASVVTDRLPASRWREGFEAAASAHGGKVVLDWTEAR
jgi:threonine 3-dehydrogenase